VVEHSLGKGEVESSILSCSTIFPKRFQALRVRALPFPPVFNLEQNLKDAPKLGEISGSKFAFRSAHLQHGLQRRAARSLAPPRLTFPFSLEGARAQDTAPRSTFVGRSLPPTPERTTFRTDAWIEFGIGGQKAVMIDGRCRQISEQE
jgi:hypothetical protein